jgi:transmembrane sensor
MVMKDDTQLARWLADEMDAAELDALKNSAEYPTLQKMKEQFSQLAKPQFDSERILNEVLSHDKNPTKVIPLYRKFWLQAAAVAVLLLAASIILLLPKRIDATEKMLAFDLPDHSKVILNEGSKASYNKFNWANNREITLEGEAYFEVAKGKTFVVTTHLGTVTVVGTRFNVRSINNQFDVDCFQGKVRVHKGTEDIMLTPNESVAFISDDKSEMSHNTISKPEWLNPELTFTKAALTSVISELEREYDTKIGVDSTSPQLFTGSLPSNDLDTALTMLCKTFHLKVERKADMVILVPVDAH